MHNAKQRARQGAGARLALKLLLDAALAALFGYALPAVLDGLGYRIGSPELVTFSGFALAFVSLGSLEVAGAAVDALQPRTAGQETFMRLAGIVAIGLVAGANTPASLFLWTQHTMIACMIVGLVPGIAGILVRCRQRFALVP